jgi:hypothetical protein
MDAARIALRAMDSRGRRPHILLFLDDPSMTTSFLLASSHVARDGSFVVFQSGVRLRYSLNPARHLIAITVSFVTLGGFRGYTDSSGRQGPQFWGEH